MLCTFLEEKKGKRNKQTIQINLRDFHVYPAPFWKGNKILSLNDCTVRPDGMEQQDLLFIGMETGKVCVCAGLITSVNCCSAYEMIA